MAETNEGAIVPVPTVDCSPTNNTILFRHKLEDLSQLYKERVHSKHLDAERSTWELAAQIHKTQIARGRQTTSDGLERKLVLHLNCHGEWSKDTTVQVNFIPQREGCKPLRENLAYLKHDEQSGNHTFRNFITWTKLIDPEKGFLKNDSIIMDICLLNNSFTTPTIDESGPSFSSDDTTFSQTINGISKLKGDILSDYPTYVRGLPWRILTRLTDPPASDKGQPAKGKQLGIFLQFDGETKSKSKFWSCKATAQLRIAPQKSKCKPFYKNIQHVFCNEANDCGFNDFIAWDKLADPKNGLIKDDKLKIQVVVQNATFKDD